MNNKVWIGIIAIAVLVVALFGSRQYATNQASQDQEIHIGSILILSGEGASWGEASKNGIDMAVTDINAKGGVLGKQLVVTHEDNQSSASKSVSAFQKLTGSGINFIIGPNWSTFGLPLVDLAKQKKAVVISPSLGLKDFNEANEYLFNTWPHDDALSRKLAEYVYAKGYRNVALFGIQDVWNKTQTQAFSEAFKKLGGTIAFTYEPLISTTDVRSEVAKFKQTKADAVVLTNSGFSLLPISARQMKDLGVRLPLFSLTLDSKLISDCSGACEGLQFLTFLTPTQEFETRYKQEFKRNVEIGSDSAYDAVMLLAQAMEATKSTDTTVVAHYLARVKEYKGVSGDLVSDGKRAFTKDYKVMVVKDDTPVEVAK